MTPKLGQFVKCPADRGDPPYKGQIVNIAPGIYTDLKGTRYQWVTVRHSTYPNTAHVWPSHRLGFTL